MSDKKPWEEAWRALGGGIVCGDMTPDSWSCAFWHPSGPIDERAARARLAAAAPDLARTLLSVEWGHYGHETGELECPVCWAEKWEGHKPECALAAALVKAGVTE